MARGEKALEKKIEALREELYQSGHCFHKLRYLDPKTYALSLKMDKLVNSYMKKNKFDPS